MIDDTLRACIEAMSPEEAEALLPAAREAAEAARVERLIKTATAQLPGPTLDQKDDPKRLKRERDDEHRGRMTAEARVEELERELEGKNATLDRVFRAQHARGGQHGHRGGTGRPKEKS